MIGYCRCQGSPQRCAGHVGHEIGAALWGGASSGAAWHRIESGRGEGRSETWDGDGFLRPGGSEPMVLSPWHLFRGGRAARNQEADGPKAKLLGNGSRSLKMRDDSLVQTTPYATTQAALVGS